MTTKEELIREIESAPEPLLVEVLKLMRSRKVTQAEPVEAFLDQVRHGGDYADDVTPEELAASEVAYQDYLSGSDPGLSSKELRAELFGEKA